MFATAAVKYATVWLALMPFVVVQAGIRPFDLLLPPLEFVHYNDGYIRAHGFIDLTGLTFTAISEGFEDDANFLGDEEDGGLQGGNGTTPSDEQEASEADYSFLEDAEDDGVQRGHGTAPSEEQSGGNSTAQPPHSRHRKQHELGGGAEVDGTAIDIAVFRLPRSCVHSREGCNWAELGVGNRTKYDSMLWCCSQEAIALGMCDEHVNGLGRLIIDKDKFKGEHRFVTVPAAGPMSKSIDDGHFEQNESGTYVVLYANCNERGRQIYVTGESVWKSVHGYVPGELYGFMIFYTVLAVVYFALLTWYGISMYANKESRIEIEKWIFFAICLGLLEMIFRTVDYFIWNADGSRSNPLIWIAVLTGVLKQGISQCLTVMVSLGWGVVRDSLGSTMRAIVVLGTAYIVTTAVRDLMIVFAIEEMNTLTYHEEMDIISVVKLLTPIVFFINAVFIIWILYALTKTMVYLENMKQTRKLERFVKLRCLFLFSILFATAWAIFTVVDTVNKRGVVQEEHAWAIDAGTEIIYLFVLIGVAVLWRPNPSAREYAYVMELPAMDGENELELTGATPSALDDDDNSSGGSLFVDDDDSSEHHNYRFQM